MTRFRAIRIGQLAIPILLTTLFLSHCQKRSAESSSHRAWERVPAILSRIQPPVFPAEEYKITDFGAIGDGKTDCNPALREAINKCNSLGGGRVIVPAGTFLCNGPIHLKSNVNLHLEEGAVIKFGSNPDDYLPAVLTRWEGTELFNYSPLIYAYQASNVAITGTGVVNGNAGAEFAHWKPNQKAAQKSCVRWEMTVFLSMNVFLEKEIICGRR